jgi:UDP-2,4-diacetamido-2,4,6-trideoxy-beta-L-altropyranose hydrolase
MLVFMGGSDPCNETCKALDGICRLGRADLKLDVVIGEANPHRSAVEAACAGLAHASLHVQTARMAELMAPADCAIGAGGTATWERCALGLPAVVTILAENQAPIAEAVHAIGALRLLGRHDSVSPADYASALDALDASALGAMSQAAAAICDGKGTERVIRRMTA